MWKYVNNMNMNRTSLLSNLIDAFVCVCVYMHTHTHTHIFNVSSKHKTTLCSKL